MSLPSLLEDSLAQESSQHPRAISTSHTSQPKTSTKDPSTTAINRERDGLTTRIVTDHKAKAAPQPTSPSVLSLLDFDSCFDTSPQKSSRPGDSNAMYSTPNSKKRQMPATEAPTRKQVESIARRAVTPNLGSAINTRSHRSPEMLDQHESTSLSRIHRKTLQDKAYIALDAGKADEAIHYFSLLIDACKNTSREGALLCNRSVCYGKFAAKLQEQGMIVDSDHALDMGLQDAKRATVISPSYAKAWQNMAAILELKKDREGAIRAYEQFLMLKPGKLENICDTKKRGVE